MKRTHLIVSLLLAATLVMMVPASANVLPPGGGSGPPDPLANNTGTVLATTGGTFTITSAGGTVSGQWVSWVVTDTVTGGLDFVYGVATDPSSTDIVERLTASSFAGYTTDVGYLDGWCWSGGLFTCSNIVQPTQVSRSGLGGAVIGFLFGNVIGAGMETGVLIIETNALSFTTGSFSIQDGGTITLDAFEPAGGRVPEPSSLLLFGSGLVGLGNLVRRKFAL